MCVCVYVFPALWYLCSWDLSPFSVTHVIHIFPCIPPTLPLSMWLATRWYDVGWCNFSSRCREMTKTRKQKTNRKLCNHNFFNGSDIFHFYSFYLYIYWTTSAATQQQQHSRIAGPCPYIILLLFYVQTQVYLYLCPSSF